MIYDAVISTGDVTVSGCHSTELNTNTFNFTNVVSDSSQNTYFYDVDLATGQDTMQLFLNGQTLTQEIPSQEEATNKTVFQIKTGDFFVKGAGVNSLERIKINFASSTPNKGNSKVRYDVVTGGIFIGTGDQGSSLKTSINGRYIQQRQFDEFDYFLNGQKVYSGVGVGASLGVGTQPFDFLPQFGTAANIGGVVTSDNEDEFKYTAYIKNPRTHSLTGDTADFYSNTGFIEGRTIYFINGVYEPPTSYLEAYTGVTMIKSGVNANITLNRGLDIKNISL
jgi:hypothetical protein